MRTPPVCPRLTGALLLALAMGLPARAQTPGSGAPPTDTAARTGQAAGDVSVRYAVPEIPATTFLNASSAKITRPTTPKDLLLALMNGVDDQGRVKQGFALEASPYAVIPGFQVTLEQYQRSRGSYILANLLGSLAATTAADSTATDLAYGLRATLFDGGDPMLDGKFRQSVVDAMLGCAPVTPLPIPRYPLDTVTAFVNSVKALREQRAKTELACMDKATDSLAAAYARKNWNAARLVIAYAGGQRLHGASFGSSTLLGNEGWAAMSIPLGTLMQAIGYADLASRRSADTLPLVTSFTYGGRLNIGSDALNAFVELLGQSRRNPPPAIKAQSNAWTGGIEVRAAEGLWLSTGFGKRFQDLVKADRLVVLANVRWGISAKPWLHPGG